MWRRSIHVKLYSIHLLIELNCAVYYYDTNMCVLFAVCFVSNLFNSQYLHSFAFDLTHTDAQLLQYDDWFHSSSFLFSINYKYNTVLLTINSMYDCVVYVRDSVWCQPNNLLNVCIHFRVFDVILLYVIFLKYTMKLPSNGIGQWERTSSSEYCVHTVKRVYHDTYVFICNRTRYKYI